ncbi:MAG TPA: protoporphyrinogen oxidase, partial [Nocardioides sp.]|uniref:protoporphyrinogen oxidase n=1 Tax=Nocardioides sp. TaxID=35761 RepID=UPI002EDAD502
GALRPLPRSLMGVPLDLDQLAASGVLTDEGMERVRREPGLPPEQLRLPDEDVSVGDLVAARLGDEVTDRLVEPLLGGVYAGRAREISVRAAVPQLVTLAARGSMVEQAAALPVSDVPVFAGVTGGMWQLPAALAAGVEVRLGTPVDTVTRTAQGFLVETGGETGQEAGGEAVPADAVVVATPAAVTARLLRSTAPGAAAELRAIESASVAVVTFAFRAADVATLDGTASGFLVPPVDGRRIKAATFSFAKWDWVRRAGGDLLVLRTSLGRHGDDVVAQAGDDELVADSLADLAAAAGVRARPVATHVQRWVDGLPQYAVGHLDRVARIRAAVAAVPGLAVCGAAYDGVGIPAVIASAHRAAAEIAGT